jgi:single-strand DNA-binding protein
VRHTPDGKPVTNLSIAINRKWTNADGTPGKETLWFRVACWGKLAEVCDQYLSKGRRVLVEDRLRPDPETSRLAFFFPALTSLTFSAILGGDPKTRA